MEYKLSDTSIAQIVQLLQLGILTGTDITDQIRTMRLSVDKETGSLVPSEDFVEMFNENIDRMQSEADNQTTD